jgi:hypothetical protein
MPKRSRPRGAEVPDAAAAEIRVRAREAGADVISELKRLCCGAESESLRLAAIKELLDRGFGRAAPDESPGGMIGHVMVDDGYAD